MLAQEGVFVRCKCAPEWVRSGGFAQGDNPPRGGITQIRNRL